jgi:hypothetical protein
MEHTNDIMMFLTSIHMPHIIEFNEVSDSNKHLIIQRSYILREFGTHEHEMVYMKNTNKLKYTIQQNAQCSKQRFYIWNIMSLAMFQMYNLCTETQCILLDIMQQLLVPVAVWSKAKVCSCSPTENVGMNATRSMDFCLLWVLCVPLRQADHSSRGVILTSLFLCVK